MENNVIKLMQRMEREFIAAAQDSEKFVEGNNSASLFLYMVYCDLCYGRKAITYGNTDFHLHDTIDQYQIPSIL